MNGWSRQSALRTRHSWSKNANGWKSLLERSSRARAREPMRCISFSRVASAFSWMGRGAQAAGAQSRPAYHDRRDGAHHGQARSATIEAEVASVLYVLKAEGFERIRRSNPPLCQALLTFVVKVMAERLSFANRTIGALLR